MSTFSTPSDFAAGSLQVSGSKIKELRAEHGWTQEALSEQADLSPQTIKKAEASGRLRFETIKNIADAFGVSPRSLWGDGMQYVTLAIDGTDDADEVVEKIKELYPNAEIIDVRKGSVMIDMKLSVEDLDNLIASIAAGRFDQFGKATVLLGGKVIRQETRVKIDQGQTMELKAPPLPEGETGILHEDIYRRVSQLKQRSDQKEAGEAPMQMRSESGEVIDLRKLIPSRARVYQIVDERVLGFESQLERMEDGTSILGWNDFKMICHKVMYEVQDDIINQAKPLLGYRPSVRELFGDDN